MARVRVFPLVLDVLPAPSALVFCIAVVAGGSLQLMLAGTVAAVLAHWFLALRYYPRLARFDVPAYGSRYAQGSALISGLPAAFCNQFRDACLDHLSFDVRLPLRHKMLQFVLEQHARSRGAHVTITTDVSSDQFVVVAPERPPLAVTAEQPAQVVAAPRADTLGEAPAPVRRRVVLDHPEP